MVGVEDGLLAALQGEGVGCERVGLVHLGGLVGGAGAELGEGGAVHGRCGADGAGEGGDDLGEEGVGLPPRVSAATARPWLPSTSTSTPGRMRDGMAPASGRPGRA